MTVQPGDAPLVDARVDPRRMTRLYIIALSLVAALTLAGQFVVQLSLSALQDDTTTVNNAGRQRMLSQRIPRLTMDLAAEVGLTSTTNSSEAPALPSIAMELLRTELGDLLKLWNANHSALSQGSSSVEHDAHHATVKVLFAEIDPHVAKVTDIVTAALEREPEATSPILSSIERAELIAHSDAFLVGMDQVVAHWTAASRERVSRLRWIERALLLATLIVLLCEGCFVFSPAVASLSRAFQRLQSMSAQLELAKDVAESANRAKSDFLARVSHELRTPLHAVLGMLSLTRRGRLPPAQRRRVDLATRGARTLRRLVDDLLDSAGAEAGQPLQLQLTAVDAARVIDDCVRMMEPLARRKGISMIASVNLPMPIMRYLLDEFRLRQILMNLLQNAIRYTCEGSVQCSCDLEEPGSEKWLRISVRDTGAGIAPEQQARIFENFVRLDSSGDASAGNRRLGVGLGLGLPITASLVKSMGGQLTLDSQPGRGSVFTVAIPVREASLDADDPPKKVARRIKSQSPQRRHRSHAESKARALIVDDAATNRILMKEYLKRLEISAVAAPDLVRAWELLRQHQPHWIFLDARLPQEDPIEFIRRVRHSIEPQMNQPVIVIVTADIHFAMNDLPVDAWVDGILHKPLAIEQLQETLSSLALTSPAAATSVTLNDPVSEKTFATLRLELKELLKERLPEELESLQQAVSESNSEMIALIAHRLRGSAANAAWSELAAACEQLEASANNAPDSASAMKELQRLATANVW